MSSSTYHEVRTCPHCGRKALHVEQNDFSGYCDSSSTCKHCGYQIYADADCGPWEQASYKANRKDGVIVAGFFSEDSGEFFIETAPGSLIGARRFAKLLDPDRLVFLPNGENPELLVDNLDQDDHEDAIDEFAVKVAAAKAFFDKIELTDTPFARN